MQTGHLFAVLAGSASIVALAGCSSSPPAPPTTVTVTSTLSASAAEQQQIDADRAAMDEREQELDARESAISTAEAEAAANMFSRGDGTFLVGQEIQPGTWRSEGSTRPPASCYWARLRSFDGSSSNIIDNGSSDGPTIVTIAPSDVAFETNRCGTWTRIG